MDPFASGLCAGLALALLAAALAASCLACWLSWRGARRTRAGLAGVADLVEESGDASLRACNQLAEMLVALSRQHKDAEQRRSDDRLQ